MSGSTKLMTPGGGGLILTPASSIASDVTVSIPSQTCTLGIQGPAIQVYCSTAQAITNVTSTIVQADTKVFDTNGCYNNTGSTVTLNGLSVPAYSFCPNIAGYYQVNAQAILGSTIGVCEVEIYKTGTRVGIGASGATDGGNVLSSVSQVLYCNGSSDYIQFHVYQNSGATKNLFTGSSAFNNMSIAFVRAA